MPTTLVRYDVSEWVAGLDGLGRAGQVGKARALRRTATTIEARLARDVATDTGLRVRDVKEEIRTTIDVAGRSARIAAAGARIPLIKFQARGPEPSRGKGRGVTARSLGGRKRYPNAFIAKVTGPLPSGVVSPGHRGVFIRAQNLTRKSRGAWSKNLPIKQLYGPSIPHVFAKYLPAAGADAGALLAKNLEHEFQFALRQE